MASSASDFAQVAFIIRFDLRTAFIGTKVRSDDSNQPQLLPAEPPVVIHEDEEIRQLIQAQEQRDSTVIQNFALRFSTGGS